jgi:hypothetical protein
VQKLEGKVSLSLDAWTLNNQYTFLAIAAHYVTNDGQLGSFFTLESEKIMIYIFSLAEELLINFQELIGQHSGENMAKAVWAMMELYSLIGKVNLGSLINGCLLNDSQVITIVMDNTSNNNTLVTSLEQRCKEWGVPFSAQDAQMCCMPHTVYLATIKVLKGFFLIWELYSTFINCSAP